jgi:SEC-C domain protein
MTLLENWRLKAYSDQTTEKEREFLWKQYFIVEKGIYEQLLEKPKEVISLSVKELANKYGTDIQTITGFLDGINDSLKNPNPIETMDEDTQVTIDIDLEKLYYNMVEARAEWLYNLEAWDKIFTDEKRKELYLSQKKSGTVVKGKKVGRNDSCPCGSGKKYKHCCGKN